MKLSTPLAILLIALSALLLRSYRLSERGLINGDERGTYRAVSSSAAYLRWRLTEGRRISSPSAQRQSVRKYLERRHLAGSTGMFSYRFLYRVIGLFVLFLTGPTLANFLMINAVLGTATVGLVFWLAHRLDANPPFPLLAALALALSGSHLIWSRTGFAHLSASFFLILGYACYAEAVWGARERPERWLVGAGLALGAAFGAHPTSAPYLGVCFLIELYRMVRVIDVRRAVGNLLLMGVGVLVMLILLEGLSWSLNQLVPTNFPETSQGRAHSYFEAIFDVRGSNIGKVSRGFSPLSTYVRMPFLYGEGLVFSAVAATGLAWASVHFLKERREGHFFLLAALALPVISYFTIPVLPDAPRNLTFLAPIVALLVGRGLSVLWGQGRRFAWRWAIVLLFVAAQFAHSWYLFDIRSSHSRAADWLTRYGGGRFLDLSRESGFLYDHGIKIYHYKNARPDGKLEVIEWPSQRPLLVSPTDEPLYSGLVGDANPETSSKVAALLDLKTEAASFPNTRPFTKKKIAILNTLRWGAQTTGLRGATAWINRQLAGEQIIVRGHSLRLFRVKAAPRKHQAAGGEREKGTGSPGGPE